ncbi:hypothetical protein ACGF0J_11630 [Nonomuraea sp. NPDC047897]|uniref:hypothetical protein n=1 Tax=Nonomuraea sp. NPDC047897 TaxID=3364346 RepID=UPI00371F0303
MTTPQHLPIGTEACRAVQQLAVLRTTYPGWEIHRILDSPERATWTATLRREVTPIMRSDGVEQHVERPDVPSLASALAHQVALLHNHRALKRPAS